MSFFSKFRIPIFKRLQQKLHVEEEWRAFRSGLARHRFKLTLFSAAGFYYFKKEEIDAFYAALKEQTKKNLQQGLKDLETEGKVVLKRSVIETLKEPEVKSGGVVYLEQILKEKQVVNSILDTLLKTVKEESFVAEAKVLGKKIAVDAANDKQVEQELTKLFARVARTPEIKAEAVNITKHVFSQDETKAQLVEMFTAAFNDPIVQDALKQTLSATVYDILNEKETARQVKGFVFNVGKASLIPPEFAAFTSMLQSQFQRVVGGQSATEPTTNEPAAAEPTIKESTIKESVATEPVVKEPTSKEPEVKEPVAVVESKGAMAKSDDLFRSMFKRSDDNPVSA